MALIIFKTTNLLFMFSTRKCSVSTHLTSGMIFKLYVIKKQSILEVKLHVIETEKLFCAQYGSKKEEYRNRFSLFGDNGHSC